MKKFIIFFAIFALVFNTEARPSKKLKPKFGKYRHKCPKKKNVITNSAWEWKR